MRVIILLKIYGKFSRTVAQIVPERIKYHDEDQYEALLQGANLSAVELQLEKDRNKIPKVIVSSEAGYGIVGNLGDLLS